MSSQISLGMDYSAFIDALTAIVTNQPELLFPEMFPEMSRDRAYSCSSSGSSGSSSGWSSLPQTGPQPSPMSSLAPAICTPGNSQVACAVDSSGLQHRRLPVPPLMPSSFKQSEKRKLIPKLECVFCKRNNESRAVYSTHVLKDPQGIVVCPVLRLHSCEICHNGGGDHAHTRRHCPLNPDINALASKPTPVLLKERVNSMGRPFRGYNRSRGGRNN